jgi:hypothetical protein
MRPAQCPAQLMDNTEVCRSDGTWRAICVALGLRLHGLLPSVSGVVRSRPGTARAPAPVWRTTSARQRSALAPEASGRGVVDEDLGPCSCGTWAVPRRGHTRCALKAGNEIARKLFRTRHEPWPRESMSNATYTATRFCWGRPTAAPVPRVQAWVAARTEEVRAGAEVVVIDPHAGYALARRGTTTGLAEGQRRHYARSSRGQAWPDAALD